MVFLRKKALKSDVIVTVNGKKITNTDVAERLQEHKNTNEVTPEALKLDIVDRLIMDTLLDEFINKQGLLVTQGEIDREIEKIRFDIEGRQKKAIQPLEQILALIGFGVTEFKTSIKHSIALEKYFGNKLNDKALEKYFEQNKNMFNGEAVRVSHVLIDTRGLKTDALRLQALEHIRNIKKKLTGAPVLRKRQRNTPTVHPPKMGDLGFILRKGTLAKALLDTAFLCE